VINLIRDFVLLALLGLVVGSIVGGYVPEFGAASATLAQEDSLLVIEVIDFTSTSGDCLNINNVGEVCFSNNEFFLEGVPIHYDFVRNIKLYAYDGKQAIFKIKERGLPTVQSIGALGEPSAVGSTWYQDSTKSTIVSQIDTQLETSTPNAYGVTTWGVKDQTVDLIYANLNLLDDPQRRDCDVKMAQVLITPSGKTGNIIETEYVENAATKDGNLVAVPLDISQPYGFNSAGEYQLYGKKIWKCYFPLSGESAGYAFTSDNRLKIAKINIVDLPDKPMVTRILLSSSSVSCDSSVIVTADVQNSDDVSIVVNSKVINLIRDGEQFEGTIYHDQLHEGESNTIYVNAFNSEGNAFKQINVFAKECVIQTTAPPVTTSPPTTEEPTDTSEPMESPSPDPTDTPKPSSPIDCSKKTICVEQNQKGGEYNMKEKNGECVPDFLSPTESVCVEEGAKDEPSVVLFLIGVFGTIGLGVGISMALKKK
jgi:hypothetical protein